MLEVVDRFVVLTQRAADIVLANGAPPEKVVVNRLGVSEPISPLTGSIGLSSTFAGLRSRWTTPLPWAECIVRASDSTMAAASAGGRNSLPSRPARLPPEQNSITRYGSPPCSPKRFTVVDSQCDRQLRRAVLPSRCLEGGPTAGLEAMAAGVPVIAASFGGVAEVVEDGVNARLVPPGDVDRLAAALIEVASHPEETIDRWRERLPRPRTMREVARDYLDLYAG
jgi:glycosyltransferase involved in cell wall biosynthesis